MRLNHFSSQHSASFVSVTGLSAGLVYGRCIVALVSFGLTCVSPLFHLPGGALPYTLAQCRRVVIVSDAEERAPGARSRTEPAVPVSIEDGAATTTRDDSNTRTSANTLHTSLESGVYLEDAGADGDVELGPTSIDNVANGAHIASPAEPITSPATASGCGTLQAAKYKWRPPCPEQFCSHASYLTFAWLLEYASNSVSCSY